MANQFEYTPEGYPDLVKDTNGWKNFVISQFAQEYFHTISKKIKESYDNYDGELDVYPPQPLVFKAFELTPFDGVKVVLLGQG
jgi:uracil-DNA glycosylase